MNEQSLRLRHTRRVQRDAGRQDHGTRGTQGERYRVYGVKTATPPRTQLHLESDLDTVQTNPSDHIDNSSPNNGDTTVVYSVGTFKVLPSREKSNRLSPQERELRRFEQYAKMMRQTPRGR